MERLQGHFTVKKITKFEDLKEGDELSLPESDLAFQDGSKVYQFSYAEPKDDRRFIIEPGTFAFANSSAGISLNKLEFKPRTLLETVNNTATIINEAKTFFSRLHIYEKLNRPKKRGILLYSAPGMGKCLGLNTPILMFNGTIKMVQDVVVGDLLMGPDSTSRLVETLSQGREEMFRVSPTKGESFTANRSHILSLRLSGEDTIHNLSIDEFLKLSPRKQERLKAWRTAVEFESVNELLIDPYMLGLWLGDGSSNKPEIASADDIIKIYVRKYFKDLGLNVKEVKQANDLVAIRGSAELTGTKQDRNIYTKMLRFYSLMNNKHIPLVYKTASRENRLKLLAGLVDSDGHYDMGCFDFCQKSSTLANDIAFLARSLGMAAYITEVQKSCTNSKIDHIGTYYRVRISGHLDSVPNLLERKKPNPRRQIKNVLRTGINLESLGEGDYYGFTLNGDKLFLLGDFTVTHNTSSIEKFCQDFVDEDPGTVVLVWPTSEVEAEAVSKFLSQQSSYSEECTRMILIIEDIGGGERDSEHGRYAITSGLLNLLDGVGLVFKLPTFIVATTNHPENLLSSLANRPGRFDMMMKLEPPSPDERIRLLEFVVSRSLTDEERAAITSKGTEAFSIAHIEEIAVRAELHDKSFKTVVDELITHTEVFNKGFASKKASLGFNSFED